jgi:hypothetical protein
MHSVSLNSNSMGFTMASSFNSLPFAFLFGQNTAPMRDVVNVPHPNYTADELRKIHGTQDVFNGEQIQKPVIVTPLHPRELTMLMSNPARLQKLTSVLSQHPALNTEGQNIEPLGQRLAMFQRLHHALKPEGQQALESLLSSGKLLDTQGDTPNSTLYYLYGMASMPAAKGWNPNVLIEDMVNILSHANDIEQDNTPLKPEFRQSLLKATNNPDGLKHEAQALPTPRHPEDFNIIGTFNCSEAAEMARMASLHPKELTRHLYELTRPAESFYEKATPEELSPEDPSQAYMVLAKQNMAYRRLPNGELLVEVPAPRTAVIRAHNTQAKLLEQGTLGSKEASPLQVLYQETLLYNGARKSYDVATDKRDMLDIAQTGVMQTPHFSNEQKAELVSLLQNPKADEARKAFLQRFNMWQGALTPAEKTNILANVWGENQGLTGDEKLFNERLVNDGTQYQLVNYQALGSPPTETTDNYGDLYLYGYYRDFNQIQQDLMKALAMGEQPILNESIAFDEGKTVPGHEVKLHSSDVDPNTGERRFYLVNTDDHKKGLECVYAHELIPKIGHISLPKTLADEITAQMQTLNGNVLVPDGEDAKHYVLQPTVPAEVANKALAKQQSNPSLPSV